MQTTSWEMILRPAHADDLTAVLAIEAQAFASPWTRAMFEATLRHAGTAMIVAADAGVVAGYAMVRVVLEDAELLTIAVAPAHQRRGVGRALLDWVTAHARAASARALFLEVRAGNHRAQQLYRAGGFRPLGVRRAYYQHPTEDAVTMAMTF